MAIITENTNNSPMFQAVLADSQESPFIVLPPVGTAIDFCVCDYECQYFNNVFADLLSTDDFKNDKSSFLIGLAADSSTLEIRLIGNGQDVVISDDTFGEYFTKGTFTNTENQLNYVGFIADWKKILTAFGGGVYYFTFTETVFNRDFVTESVKYRLSPYNETRVLKTLRLRFEQNGLIENGLDYTGLNWITEVRIEGSLRYNAPTLTLDNYQNTNRSIKQIQDKTVKNFEIETSLIPSKIGNLFTLDGVLANNILVTNYDWFAYEKYIDFPIIITEITDFKGNYRLNSLASFIFKAEERTQNNVKRNVQ